MVDAVADPQPVVVPTRRFTYEEHPPPPELASLVDCLWTSAVDAEADHHLGLVPDGCVEISRAAAGSTLVFGPTTTPTQLTLAAGGRFEGMRLRAGAARAVLGSDVDELAGLIVDGAAFLPLRSIARTGIPGHDWRRLALDALAERRHGVLDDPARVAAHLLATDPHRSVPDVARSLGFSERQLRRRFERSVGLSPSTYRRIARVQATLAACSSGSEWTFARLAQEHGYADHAHLTREVRHLTGWTPSELRRRAGLIDGEPAGAG